MNLVIDDAVEVKLATKTQEETKRPLGTWNHMHLIMALIEISANLHQGQILLKGDNVSLIQMVQ